MASRKPATHKYNSRTALPQSKRDREISPHAATGQTAIEEDEGGTQQGVVPDCSLHLPKHHPQLASPTLPASELKARYRRFVTLMRDTGCAVRPGVLLADQSWPNPAEWPLAPVEDEDWAWNKGTPNRLHSVALWDLIPMPQRMPPECRQLVELIEVKRNAVLTIADPWPDWDAAPPTDRPDRGTVVGYTIVCRLPDAFRESTTGVGPVDAWLSRAACLRSLLEHGRTSYPYRPILTWFQFEAVRSEVDFIVRKTAVGLVERARAAGEVTQLTALSQVSIASVIKDSTITDAMAEVTNRVEVWQSIGAEASLGRGSALQVPRETHLQPKAIGGDVTPDGGRRRRVKGRVPRTRAKADHVRELLSGEAPYEKTKSELAIEVGYTHQSSLARIKNFRRMWSENEKKLAARRAESLKRMVRPGD